MVRVLLPRRRVLAAAGGVLASPMVASGIARAQADWPTKQVRYIAASGGEYATTR